MRGVEFDESPSQVAVRAVPPASRRTVDLTDQDGVGDDYSGLVDASPVGAGCLRRGGPVTNRGAQIIGVHTGEPGCPLASGDDVKRGAP